MMRRIVRSALSALLVLAVLGLPAVARAAGGHDGGGHGAGAPVQAPDADRCDLGFNTKKYNDAARAQTTGTMQPSFASQFMRHDARKIMKLDPLRLAIYTAFSSTTRIMYDGMSQKRMYDGQLKNPAPHEHPLAHNWNSITDPVVCNKLKSQLIETRQSGTKYPTLGSAVQRGFTYVTPFFGGAGTHMGRWELLDDKIEPGNPEVLIYDGMDFNAKLVGIMYATLSNTEPKNVFVGNNDQWHRHQGLCFTENGLYKYFKLIPVQKVVSGSESFPGWWCELGGGKKETNAALWMMHVWVVPGCENDWGLYAHDHPYLTAMNSAMSFNRGSWRGCGTGMRPLGSPNRMETDELNIPGPLSTYRSSQFSWSQGGQTIASGPVAAELADHPGTVHAPGEEHLAGNLRTEGGFSGPAGSWPISILRKDNVIRGTVTTPAGTVATFTTAEAMRSECGVKLTATATTPDGTEVAIALDLCNPGLRSMLLDAQATVEERLQILHPAHGHDHANGLVRYDLSSHPGENHGTDEHLSGKATTLAGFDGLAGAWDVSLIKNTTTGKITGTLKNPDGSKTFSFTVNKVEPAACPGGAVLTATGSEAATPSDPQNPVLTICDSDITAFAGVSGAGGQESLQILHPAHGHDHANGPVRYEFDAHPGENHGTDEHILGRATTLTGFDGMMGAWTVSLLKAAATGKVTGYLKNPDSSKTFNFTVDRHSTAGACTTIQATGSEAATPSDPQNPVLTICNAEVNAMFAGHAH